jgi:hypothetical protein
MRFVAGEISMYNTIAPRRQKRGGLSVVDEIDIEQAAGEVQTTRAGTAAAPVGR